MAIFIKKLFSQLPPYLLNKFLKGISLFGTSFFYMTVLIFLSRINFPISVQATVAFLSIEISSALIKIIFPKHRPIAGKRDTLLDKYEAGSFPSIHAARIAAVAVLATRLFPQDFIIHLTLIGLVISVCVSRVYTKRHYTTDVIFGCLLGTLIMFFCLLTIKI